METYCHKCGKFVNVLLQQRETIVTWGNRKMNCIEYYVVCENCEEEQYLGTVHNMNELLKERAIRVAQWMQEHSFLFDFF